MAISLDKQKRVFELGQQIPVLSDREIARRLKISRDAAAKYRGPLPTSGDVEDNESYLSPETHIAQEKRIERMRAEMSRLRGMNRLLSRSGVVNVQDIADQFKFFLSSEDSSFTFTPKSYPVPKKTDRVFDKEHEEVAALVLSDWHLGETIRPEETNGVNKYNSVICANRLWKVIDKFKRITSAHMAMYSVKKIWVTLLGDLINGSIHQEFLLTNDLLDIPASVLAARLAILAIYELKTLGLPIEIDTVVGNHPRLLPTMPSKRQSALSLDWSIYMMVEQEFRNDPQVTVRVHHGQFGVTEQYGHRFVIEHGYGARTGTLSDRIRKMMDSPVFREATGLTSTAVDMVIIGDKHRHEHGVGYMVNGSLSGQGEYGVMLRLDPIPAVQWTFGISKSHATTYMYPLDITNLIDETASNPLSEYALKFVREHGR